ncbi:MAG: hypothetical protein SNJ69_16085, partial [Chloroflexaceae bacterium]
GTSETQPILVANGGGAPIDLTGFEFEGEFARRGGTCPTTFPSRLAPGESCTLVIAFMPNAIGPSSGRAVITLAEGAARDIALRGIGIDAQVLLPLVRKN